MLVSYAFHAVAKVAAGIVDNPDRSTTLESDRGYVATSSRMKATRNSSEFCQVGRFGCRMIRRQARGVLLIISPVVWARGALRQFRACFARRRPVSRISGNRFQADDRVVVA